MKTLTGLEKAAVLLKGLGAPTAQIVLDKVSPEQAQRVRAQMEKLPKGMELRKALREVLQEVERALLDDAKSKPLASDSIVEEVKKEAASTNPTPPPTPAQAPTPVNQPRKVDIVVKDEPPPPPPPPPKPKSPAPSNGSKPKKPQKQLPDDPLLALRELPAENLARALEGETPRTVSLLLNVLELGLAGDIFKRLPSTLRREVSVQFARQTALPPEVLKRIAQGVVKKSLDLADEVAPGADDRVKKITALFKLLERTERQDMLTNLTEKEPSIAQQIKDELYQFEDLLLMENSSVQKVLGEMDTKSLAMALKSATDPIQQKVLNNLSKRAQETLKDEIELMGSINSAKVTQARKSVVEAIQRLDERGELSMLE